MVPASSLIRAARTEAGLTQAELAARMGVDQPAVARIESSRSNPRYSTLTDALVAAGFTIEIRVVKRDGSVDVSQIRSRLEMTPAERLAAFQASQRNQRRLVERARRVG